MDHIFDSLCDLVGLNNTVPDLITMNELFEVLESVHSSKTSTWSFTTCTDKTKIVVQISPRIITFNGIEFGIIGIEQAECMRASQNGCILKVMLRAYHKPPHAQRLRMCIEFPRFTTVDDGSISCTIMTGEAPPAVALNIVGIYYLI